jgi:hypothetical protein
VDKEDYILIGIAIASTLILAASYGLWSHSGWQLHLAARLPLVRAAPMPDVRRARLPNLSEINRRADFDAMAAGERGVTNELGPIPRNNG